MRRIVVAVVGSMVLLAGCAAGDDGADTGEARPAQADGGAQAVDGQADGETDEDASAVRGTSEEGRSFMGAGGDISESVLRQRIRRAEVDVTVEDGERALAEIRSLAQRSGGFVDRAELTAREDGDGLRGTLVIRVPAETLDDVLARITAMAVDTPDTRIQTEDVTEQLIDLEARLKNLRILESELQDLLAEVRETDDPDPAQLFTVFERLRQVRDEIEQLAGRRRLLEEQVSLSTVTVNLEERPEPAAIPAEPWRPGDVLAAATAALLTALRAIGNVAIWAGVVVLPIALLAAAPVALGVGLHRRWRRGEAPTT